MLSHESKVRIIKSLSVKIWYGQNFNSEKQKSYVLIFYFILFFFRMGGVVTRFVGRRAGCTTSVCLTVMPSYANFGTSNPTKSVKLWGSLFFSSSLVCLFLSFFEGEIFAALKNVKSTKPCLFLCIVEAAYFEVFFSFKNRSPKNVNHAPEPGCSYWGNCMKNTPIHSDVL